MTKRIRHPEREIPHSEPRTAATEAVRVAEAPTRKFRVTFSPPSYVGDKAAKMDVAANDATEALAIWREATGFIGSLAVAPVVVEITGEEPADAEG